MKRVVQVYDGDGVERCWMRGATSGMRISARNLLEWRRTLQMPEAEVDALVLCTRGEPRWAEKWMEIQGSVEQLRHRVGWRHTDGAIPMEVGETLTKHVDEVLKGIRRLLSP